MDKILSPIKGRTLKYLTDKGISKESFYKDSGISASNFKGDGRRSELGGDKIVKILSIYRDLSSEWLLTGEGEMLKKKSENFSEENVSPECKPRMKAQEGEMYAQTVSPGHEDAVPIEEQEEIFNMFSGLTQEEVENFILKEFQEHLTDMLVNGRVVYPETMNMWLKEKDNEINDLRKTVWRYESLYGPLPPESNKAPLAPVIKRKQTKPRQP